MVNSLWGSNADPFVSIVNVPTPLTTEPLGFLYFGNS